MKHELGGGSQKGEETPQKKERGSVFDSVSERKKKATVGESKDATGSEIVVFTDKLDNQPQEKIPFTFNNLRERLQVKPSVIPELPKHNPDIVAKARLTEKQQVIYALIEEGKTQAEIKNVIRRDPSGTLQSIRKKIENASKPQVTRRSSVERVVKQKSITDYNPDLADKSNLTPRQREVYDLVRQGKKLTEIRELIGYAPSETIDAIRKKLESTSIALPKKPKPKGRPLERYNPELADQSNLTSRQRQVYELVRQGKKLTEIRELIGYAPENTIEAIKAKFEKILALKVTGEQRAVIQEPTADTPSIFDSWTLEPRQLVLANVRTDTPEFLAKKEIFRYRNEKGRMKGVKGIWQRRERKRHSEKHIQLIARHKHILSLTAQGFSHSEMRKELGISEKLIKQDVTKIIRELKKHKYPIAIPTLAALHAGIIAPNDVLKGFDRKKFSLLNEREQKVLNKMTEQIDVKRTSADIARLLDITEGQVRVSLTHIHQKLDAKNTTHAVALYAANKGGEWRSAVAIKKQEPSLSARKKDLLQQLAKGDPLKQIATKTNVKIRTINKHVRDIKIAYGAKNTTEAILKGIRLQQISPGEILSSIDINSIRQLKPHEKKLLNQLTRTNGRYSDYEEVGMKLKITKGRVGQTVSQINKKVGTKSKEHLAAVYKSFVTLYENK